MLEGGQTERVSLPANPSHSAVVVILAEALAVKTVARVCFGRRYYPLPVGLGLVFGLGPKRMQPADRPEPSEDVVGRMQVNTRPLPDIPEQTDTQQLPLLVSPQHRLCLIMVYEHKIVDTVGRQTLKVGWEGSTVVKNLKTFSDTKKRR